MCMAVVPVFVDSKVGDLVEHFCHSGHSHIAGHHNHLADLLSRCDGHDALCQMTFSQNSGFVAVTLSVLWERRDVRLFLRTLMWQPHCIFTHKTIR